MGSAGRRRTRVFIGFLAIATTIAVLLIWLGGISRNGRREVLTWYKSSPPQNDSGSVLPVSASPPPNVSPALPTPSSSMSNASPDLQNGAGALPNNLIIPVAGIRPDQLRDTYSES